MEGEAPAEPPSGLQLGGSLALQGMFYDEPNGG